MAANKPSSREQIKQIVAGIEQGIQDLFQSEKYADYLRTMSRFHSYSMWFPIMSCCFSFRPTPLR